ncbi:MAG: 16S rRNA (cytosine(967)-C(5))-methyltransferase RsmB [Oligoflexales bacterium]|nr:16S rRNA (cytosine(967)-C(5))-methyltransferase RsmB [Oligoflexales bacterium]
MALLSLSIAREIAYDAFVSVMEEKKRPEDVLEDSYEANKKKIKQIDKSFIKEILYGSLRWYSKIYWILQNTSNRNLDKTTLEVRASLVVGTYQIYYMDRVPDRAAVNESVEYVRKKGQASACSFVNGILRQIARRAKYFQKPDKKEKPLEYLSLQYAHPEWIVKRWLNVFNFDKTEQVLASNNKPPPYSIRSNLRKTDLSDIYILQQKLLKDEGIHSDKTHLRTALHLKSYPDISKDSLFGKGYYTIQDEASQLIGLLVSPNEGEVILDACAGPGGKLSHLYELGDEKITLIAVEQDERQMNRAKDTMARLGHDKVEWVHEDFLNWKSRKKLDKILLDAPCSGLGVLRRHPEGKWQKREDIISAMARKQGEMLRHALKLIKVGGEIIFSVCSFEIEETEDHVKNLLKEYGEHIELVSPVSRLPDYYKKYVTRKNVLLIYSGNQDEMDGFGSFIFKLKKRIGESK